MQLKGFAALLKWFVFVHTFQEVDTDHRNSLQ